MKLGLVVIPVIVLAVSILALNKKAKEIEQMFEDDWR